MRIFFIFLNRAAYVVGIAVCLTLAVLCWQATRAMHAEFLAEQNKCTQIQEVTTGYRAELSRLKQEHQILTTKPDYMDRLAREQLGMIRPDEVVFLLDR